VSERIAVRRITPPFIIICVLVLTVAGIYGYSHHRVAETMPAGPPLQSANLVMQDHDDGSISVFNAADHALVDVVPPATNGFLRVVLAGLVRERRREGEGSPAIAFHLARWPDGRLTVDDLATHQLIYLDAFGPTNAGAFGHLLDQSIAASQPCAGTATPACTTPARAAGTGK
jgi:putative photosynthetic complex assembly protein